MFSIIFLLLLYVKHCKSGNVVVIADSRGGRGLTFSARKNSGIDRTVIESLPIFRFASLRGQKDGLECAVCLNRFEPTEVLRLLPKCKHAFHVECVDTWLDAHSTCPLCRHRVDPEDVLLVEDASIIIHQNQPVSKEEAEECLDLERGRSGAEMELRRVSGRHSSAGERVSGFLQIILPRTSGGGGNLESETTSLRRSLDSAGLRKKREGEGEGIGCLQRPRKDGLLLSLRQDNKTICLGRRLEHRIIVSSSPSSSGFQFPVHQRWSDVQPSDLLYLRSEMIISESVGGGGGKLEEDGTGTGTGNDINEEEENKRVGGTGRGVINSRSMSEITGLSRYWNRQSDNMNSSRQHGHHRLERQRQAGVVSRWLAWISQPQTDVR